mgnify:CR=1 FL=1
MIFLLRTCHYEISYNIYLYTYKKKPEDDYSSGFLYIPLSGKCIFCPQFCPHLPTFSGFFARFSSLLDFLVGSVMRFMRFRIFRLGIVIVQMIQLISLAELFAANPPAESVLKSYSDFMRAEGTGITGTPLIDLTVNSSSPCLN